jgi:hypothetical protein
LDFYDETFWLSLIVLVAILLALLVTHRKNKGKTPSGFPLSFNFAFILISYSIIVLFGYSINRPSSIIGIVTNIVLSTFGVGFFSAVFYFFGKLNLFDKKITISRLELSARAFTLFFYYIVFSIVISNGINFLFNGLISSQMISLTPEFENYAIPTMAVLVLILFRVIPVFSSKILSVLKDVIRDVIIFSFLMFWIKIVALSVGITFQGNLIQSNFIQSAGNGLLLFVLVIFGIGIEVLSLQIKKDYKIYQKNMPALSIEQMLLQGIFQAFRRNQPHQKLIGDYFEKKPQKKKDPSVDKLENIIDRRFSIKYRGKVLKATRVISWVLILAALMGMIIVMSQSMQIKQ